jgi:hypothetical protein
VPREAVDEVVLAAVHLVGDDNDVAPLRERQMPVALLTLAMHGSRPCGAAFDRPNRLSRLFVLGEELLDRGEDHAAGGDL